MSNKIVLNLESGVCVAEGENVEKQKEVFRVGRKRNIDLTAISSVRFQSKEIGQQSLFSKGEQAEWTDGNCNKGKSEQNEEPGSVARDVPGSPLSPALDVLWLSLKHQDLPSGLGCRVLLFSKRILLAEATD